MKKGIDYIGIGCGAINFNKEGKVFLAKRAPKARNEIGKWDFPGGSVEFGEKCKDAIKREILEEYNFKIQVIGLLEVVDHIIPKENQHWISPSFIAKHVSGNPKIIEPEKRTEIKWVNLSEIDPNSLTITSRSNFEEYIKKYGFKLDKN